MVMEFVEGRSLDRYHGTHQEETWILLYQLGEALAFIHQHGLLHLDLKPSNVLVTRTRAYGGDEKPLVKLLDFGGATGASRSASNTASRTIVGSWGTPLSPIHRFPRHTR